MKNNLMLVFVNLQWIN